MSSQKRAVVRSYQRLFSPDRRIYAIDGRTIPVPGGVPLRWLGAATMIVVCSLMVAGPRPVVVAAAAGLAYVPVARLGRRREALIAGTATAAAVALVGAVIGMVDWPLRFVVLPAVGATVLTQLAPDGRKPSRYLLSLLRAQVAGRRRGGRALGRPGNRRRVGGTVRVAADRHGPALAWARVIGPCRLVFAEPVLIVRRRKVMRLVPVAAERRRLGVMVDQLDLAAGQRAEVRP